MKAIGKIAALFLTTAFIGGAVAFTPTDANAKDKQESAKVVAPTEGYWQTSARYNYKILCPYKPEGVIPAKMFFNDNSKKGDVIILETFGGDIFNVKTAWVVLVDAFEPDALPDLTKLNDESSKSMLEKIQENNGYVFIAMAELTDGNKGIYAVTSKEVEIDSDNDGKVDAVAQTDKQTVVTFFRGQLGGRFCVQLIDNPDLRTAIVNQYQGGVASFTELKPETDRPKKSDKKKK